MCDLGKQHPDWLLISRIVVTYKPQSLPFSINQSLDHQLYLINSILNFQLRLNN